MFAAQWWKDFLSESSWLKEYLTYEFIADRAYIPQLLYRHSDRDLSLKPYLAR
jgi:hypothetical protein